jgi:hypothetical protein
VQQISKAGPSNGLRMGKFIIEHFLFAKKNGLSKILNV